MSNRTRVSESDTVNVLQFTDVQTAAFWQGQIDALCGQRSTNLRGEDLAEVSVELRCVHVTESSDPLPCLYTGCDEQVFVYNVWCNYTECVGCNVI